MMSKLYGTLKYFHLEINYQKLVLLHHDVNWGELSPSLCSNPLHQVIYNHKRTSDYLGPGIYGMI